MLVTLLTVFSTSFILALSGAIMPGPVLTVTVSESVRRGAIAGPLMIFGHGLLELALVVALFAGLAPFLTRDDVFIFISLVGGSILVWMAWSMFKEVGTLSLNTEQHAKKGRSLILAGVMLSLANPYWFIWWATIGIGYIVYSAQFGVAGVVFFFAGHIVGDLAWYSLISLGVAKGKRFFSDIFYRRLICVCASFLLIFSCYFFYSGMDKGYALLQQYNILS